MTFALGAGSSALAAAPARKEPPKDAELTKKEEGKVPERDLAGDIRRKPKEKVKERPALEYDQYRLGVELQVGAKRQEQIETLGKIIQLGPAPGEAPQLIFRLAELYYEESKYYFMEANRKDDDIFKAKADKNPARLQQAEAEKKASLKKSESFQNLAIDQYRTIVKKYPKYERMDEVLFFLGHNMWESSKEKDAIVVYQKLLKDFPNSKYVPDAWVAVGQYFFNTSNGNKDELNKALMAFKKATSFTESKVYGYALYMQGWCLYNLGDYGQAMDKFKAVVYYGELQDKSDTRSITLTKQARNDYVLAYSRYGDVLAARSDFQKVGGDANWWNMLKGLANLYFEDGKDKESTIVYNQMIRERPLSPEAPFFQARIVDCVMRVGNKKITVNQVRELVRIIKEVEKANVVTKEEDKKALSDAKELAERTMSNLAVNWHQEAKKTRDEQVFFLAAEVYQDYLEVFSDNPKAYDLRFYYAELLNDNLNKYDRAAEEYTRVVLDDVKKMDPPKDKNGKAPAPQKPGRWLTNASYNAILAYDEVVKVFEKNEQLPKADPRTKLPIPPPKKALLAACERYIKYVPHGDKKVEVMFKAGNLYYRYNYFDQAVDIFAKIALNYPEHELAEYAANLVLDSYNILEDWQKVNEWARKFYAAPKLAKGKFKEDLAKVLEQSAFKLVNIAEDKGDFAKAAEAYMNFVNEFPNSQLADLALRNAAVDYFKAHMLDKAIEVRNHLIAKYPKSRHAPESVYANGEAYEAMADFEHAADAYEAYANSYQKQNPAKGSAAAAAAARRKKAAADKGGEQAEGPKYEEAKAQTALFNAGIFREGLGQFKEALRDRNLYLDLWPNAKESEQIFLSIADLHEKSGGAGKAIKQLEEYEKKYGKDPDKLLTTEHRMAKLYTKMNAKTNLSKTQDRAYAYYKKLSRSQREKLSPTSIELAAKAAFAEVEPEFVKYTKLGLPSDEKKLKAAFEAKQKALVDVQKRYAEVVGMKAAEPAICSLYKIGLLYKNLVDVLVAAPIPEMPFPKQLNPIKHLWNRPWQKWPKDYKEALSEQDFENIKKQLADAKVQFEEAYRAQLLELSRPVEAKAADAFATTVQKGREMTIYNDCYEKAYALLAEKYAADKFPKVSERLMPLKAGEVSARVGASLLATVQPVPPKPVKAARPTEPAPDFDKMKSKDKDAEPGAATSASGGERPPDDVDAPPAPDRNRDDGSAPPPRKTRGEGEPEDPDLL